MKRTIQRVKKLSKIIEESRSEVVSELNMSARSRHVKKLSKIIEEAKGEVVSRNVGEGREESYLREKLAEAKKREEEYISEIQTLAARIKEIEQMFEKMQDFQNRLPDVSEMQIEKKRELEKLKEDNEEQGRISMVEGKKELVQGDKSVTESLLCVIERIIENQGREREMRVSGKEVYLPALNGRLPNYSFSQENGSFKNVELFIQELEYAMPSRQWNDGQRVIGGLSALKGEVLNQVRCLPEYERNTWAKLKAVLREKFAVTEQTLALLKSRFKPRRKEGEDVLSFMYRVRGELMNFDPKGVWSSERRVSKLIDVL